MRWMLCLPLFLNLLAAEDAREVFLWPNGAPGSEGKTDPELREPANAGNEYARVSRIHKPSLTVFLPAKEKATGTAMIVAPGGGHRVLAIAHEGWNVARYLNSIGVAAFVLKYRLGREEGSTYNVDVHPLMDAQRAIRLVRSRAAEWGVDASRVGIMGFSAGGHVALMAGTKFDRGNPGAADPLDRLSSRPDFQALIYPGVRMEQFTIPKDTPPTFLVSADNDKNPSIAISEIYPMLKKQGIATEIHVYNSGGHGFGIRDEAKSVAGATWYVRMKEWMGDLKLLHE